MYVFFLSQFFVVVLTRMISGMAHYLYIIICKFSKAFDKYWL